MFATRVARANYVNTKSIGEGMSLGSQQPFSTAEAEAAKHLDQRRRASSRASRCPRRGSIDVDKVGAVEARKLESEEHKALGYRPPPGSLASQAQSAAARNRGELTEPTRTPSSRMRRKSPARRRAGHPTLCGRHCRGQEAGVHAAAQHPEKSAGQDTAALIKAVEDSASDKRELDLVAEIQSEELETVGHLPETGSLEGGCGRSRRQEQE
ncbi:hypothetical protein FOMPIDRAFT_89233 [Fomitopsis schrenkii]|uniref:Uncharacterized protein n=1 Tax=Fomitopsis schrenkii TaxID=2126942 RepID=S8DWF7_FOMSC|nr:hypothetical protein FOMPIDRAFT_89233 [Fomitopsis schrenkii]